MATSQQVRDATDESTGREITVGGLRIHYNDLGTGDPILCIHGGGPGANSWSNFRSNLQDLALGHRVLMLDMPGWGRSELPDNVEEGPLLAYMANVIRGFLDNLDLDRVDIIGNSMGGQFALKLAIESPERVKHLVVIGSSPTKAIAIQAQPIEAIGNIVRFYRGEGPSLEKMELLLRSLVWDQTMIDTDVIRERFEAATTDEAMRQLQPRMKLQAEDLYFDLEKNVVPTLIVWGIDDKGGALEVALIMLRRFQDARLHLFQRCGHWAQIEHREEFGRVVLNFFLQ